MREIFIVQGIEDRYSRICGMQIIRDLVNKALEELKLETVGFSVTHPKEESHGDYSVNVAMILAKQLGKNPRDLAQEIVEQLQSDKTTQLIDKVEVAGPGFINFYLKPELYLTETKKAIEEGYGRNESGHGKLAIVEYSSPNIAKPFTIGHLRSTVIGDAVANLLEMNGWKVMRDNHLGDWGTQFGKQIAAIKKWGDIEAIGKAENPVKELVALYVKFHEEAEKDPTLEDEARSWFVKLEKGDQEARELWQKCIDWSWKEFSRIYELLGIHHSEEFNGGRGLGESFFEDKMGVVLATLAQQDWYKEGKEGAKLVFFPDDKYSPAMILKKDGATLYHTRDLATDKYRLDTYKPDLVINEVGTEQQLYFQQLYEIEKMLGWYKEGQRVHVMHGMFRFKEGKMSTRKGNVIWLEEVLDEAIGRAATIRRGKLQIPTFEHAQSFDDRDTLATGTGRKPGLAEALDTTDTSLNAQVGIGALKWNDLKGEPRRDIVFDWEEILNMKGNSGPFVQYTYARCSSILRKFQVDSTRYGTLSELLQGTEPCKEEMGLLRWIYRYPEVVSEAGSHYAPHLVATYIYELSQRFNSFYQACRVEENGEVNVLRYMITEAVENVLKSGLGLLGISAPEEM